MIALALSVLINATDPGLGPLDKTFPAPMRCRYVAQFGDVICGVKEHGRWCYRATTHGPAMCEGPPAKE